MHLFGVYFHFICFILSLYFNVCVVHLFHADALIIIKNILHIIYAFSLFLDAFALLFDITLDSINDHFSIFLISGQHLVNVPNEYDHIMILFYFFRHFDQI